MTPHAVLFGSIGTISETSELQRDAFNAAFEAAGLDWSWGHADYRHMLETPGGLARIESYNRARGARIDAEAIHGRKTVLFQEAIEAGLDCRPGVLATIEALRDVGARLALCTTTEEANALAVLRAARGLSREHFAFIGHRGMVERTKPAPDIYARAMSALGVTAEDAIAIEDSPEGVIAAKRAGLRVVAFPGAMHVHRSFETADLAVDTLTPQALGLRSRHRVTAAE